MGRRLRTVGGAKDPLTAWSILYSENQNGNPAYSREIIQAARGITGWPLWLAGKFLVELRDLAIYKIGPEKRWWDGVPINPYPVLLKLATG